MFSKSSVFRPAPERGGRGEQVLTTVQEVADKMASIADSNIEDPVSMRNNSWIFSHFPKYGQGNTLPRIGFHKISETGLQASLGTTATFEEADIQCTIVVKRGKKYDYDDDGTPEEEENLISYLKQQVKNTIVTNQDQLTGLENVTYVKYLDSTVRKPESKNIIFLAMTFEARIDNCDVV